MKKVKILSYRDEDLLSYEINQFIANHNVTDIQFQAFSIVNSERYSAMIIYEEIENG